MRKEKVKRQSIRANNVSTGDYKVFATGEKSLGCSVTKLEKTLRSIRMIIPRHNRILITDTYMTDLFLDRITIDNTTKNVSQEINSLINLNQK